MPSTGMQAYAHMLRVIANYSRGFRVAFSMSLPFPSGMVAHSRRVGMDQPFGFVGVTMNALKGGIWLRELHALDPDSITLNHSGWMHTNARRLKAVVAGGIYKYGDAHPQVMRVYRSKWEYVGGSAGLSTWKNGTHTIMFNYLPYAVQGVPARDAVGPYRTLL